MNKPFWIAHCLTALVVVAPSSVADGFDNLAGRYDQGYEGEARNHFILCAADRDKCADAEGWLAAVGPNVLHQGAEAILLPDGKVLVAGGFGWSYYPLASAELYDPEAGGWSFTGSMNVGRVGATTTLLPDAKVLVVGGLIPDIDFIYDGTRSVELYDPATERWSMTGSMHIVRASNTATLLQNGKVLVAGGSYNDVLDSAELYDPATGVWSLTGSLSERRTAHTATLLSDGKVLVAGGADRFGDANISSTVEVYDPSTGTWSRANDMGTPRAGHTAMALSNGKVLVVAGVNRSTGAWQTLRSAELFDPTTGLWTPTGGVSEARTGYTATLLLDGSVLIAGGLAGCDGVIVCHAVASTEVYDIASGTWRQSADLGYARAGHTATLLPDGTVLIEGGEQPVNATASSYEQRFVYGAERSWGRP
jgi:N-acetylneuraminic acid mutarotase